MLRSFLLCTLMLFGLQLSTPAQAQVNDVEAQITAALELFLHGASVNNANVHDQFWGEDLTYTSSRGQRYGKAQLMYGLQGQEPTPESEVTTWYSAEDIRIKEIGEAVILNFTLVATSPKQNPRRQTFFNTGIMVKRDGRWQAINWNATEAVMR